MAKHSSQNVRKVELKKQGLNRVTDETGKRVWSFRGKTYEILRDVDAVVNPGKYVQFKFTPVDQVKSEDGPDVETVVEEVTTEVVE